MLRQGSIEMKDCVRRIRKKLFGKNGTNMIMHVCDRDATGWNDGFDVTRRTVDQAAQGMPGK